MALKRKSQITLDVKFSLPLEGRQTMCVWMTHPSLWRTEKTLSIRFLSMNNSSQQRVFIIE